MSRAEHPQDFLRDVLDLLQGRRSGHLGRYEFSDSTGPDDPVRGCQLWEQFINTSSEYYVYHNEVALMRAGRDFIQEMSGRPEVVVELGPGSGRAILEKTIPLLRILRPRVYIPVDISKAYLIQIESMVKSQLPPSMITKGVVSDAFEALPFSLPPRSVLLFLGSSLSNVASYSLPRSEPQQQVTAFLGRCRALIGRDGAFLISHDANQDRSSILQSYNHPLMAAFHTTLWHRMARDLRISGDFEPAVFRYEPRWEPDRHVVAHTAICTRAPAFHACQ